MRKIGIVIIIILGIASTIVTFISILTGRYFREIQNIKSLNNKSLYMDEDFMQIKRMHGRNAALEDQKLFNIQGYLKSNGNYIKIDARDPKFLDLDLESQPLLKSKLSGEYFIKTDNNQYYEEIYRGLYFFIFLKGFFIVMIGFIAFYLIKYFKNRKYIL